MRKPELDRRLQETVQWEKLPVSILALDVDSGESVRAAFATVRSKTGCLDALVNNAGIERLGSVEDSNVVLRTDMLCFSCTETTPPS
jgi:NAD(P)-dependent dehydrogenase (short-subunit alcohol dehydrogenase family)